MTTDQTLASDLPIPPGEFLQEVLEDRGMSKDELARRMQRPASKLSQIYSGAKAITADTALQLELVLGVPAHIWTGLEAQYRLDLAREELKTRPGGVQDEAPLVRKYCYATLVALSLVRPCTKPLDKVLELRRFFGVSVLTLVPELQRYAPAFRVGGTAKLGTSSHALASWLRVGELAAHTTHCAPYSEENLRACLPAIRRLTRDDPATFRDVLQHLLAEAGVALVFCNHFPGTHAHGATFWLHRRKAVLMITDRGAYADLFWFSLLHEIGHLLLHRTQDTIIETKTKVLAESGREDAADDFARDVLIPPTEYQVFVGKSSFSAAAVRRFALAIGVHPGIVVGRLQHDGHIARSWLNELRTKITILR